MLKHIALGSLAGCALFISSIAYGQEYPVHLISEVMEANPRVTTLAIDFGQPLPLMTNLKNAFEVSAELDAVQSYSGQTLGNSGVPAAPRTILRAYTNDEPVAGAPRPGNYVILELDSADHNASSWYLGFNPSFRQILPYDDTMTYTVDLLHDLPAVSEDSSPTEPASQSETISASAEFVVEGHSIAVVDEFVQGVFELPENQDITEISYNFYSPDLEDGAQAPLVIFLHGSGQSHDTNHFPDDITADTLSPILANQGGVTWIENAPETAFVLAPQAPARDFRDENDLGGWSSAETQQLLNGLIDEIIADNPGIDTDRIYLTGLSMGAMGSWTLLTNEDPSIADRFAAAVLMNGRHSQLDEDGSSDLLANLSVPLWLMHADTDPVVDVEGSRDPFARLTGSEVSEDGITPDSSVNVDDDELAITYIGESETSGDEVRYTEYRFGDGSNMLSLGMVTLNGHFSWETSFKDQEMIEWLFDQAKSE
ncbi:PHB depolymerase family esterase [Pelagibacterium sp. H642]|uniref:PHB depolymerase family esterase n=1 Tax=Pelagibacterium sp. H642 TaxID=1881069 RepID=UPI0028158DEB|nr:PHB depolymerase family esterase [Pelagibacterium sp. H642]WMT91885.1 hypothetical protein NO934_06380 [Pelagibacterium sp. H642]